MTETTHTASHPLADAAAIEKELVRLWRETSTPEKPMLRARVLSLLAVADEADESTATEQLAQLAVRHPARNILLLVGPAEAEEAFDAHATLLCNARRPVCAEQIHLHARGAARERLPAAVRGLMTNDLPNVLWWARSPDADTELLDEMRPLSDRLVLDSSLLAEPEALAALPPAWFAGRTHDLNWSRLTTWRETIATFFDVPAARALLPTLEEVTIETGNRAAAWLLVGWLASRLGWEPVGRKGDTLRFTAAEGQAVRVTLMGAEGIGLQRVSLVGAGARFSVARTATDGGACEVALPDAPLLQQIVQLRDESPSALLSHELDLMGTNPIYEAALEMVRQIVGARP